MRKIAKKTALLLSLTALVTTAAAFGVTQKTDGIPTAHAQTANPQTAVAQTASGDTALISPDTYQQYLSLSAPMDVAVCDNYMAIADGNLIYVYDVADGEYRTYEHTLNQTDPTKNDVMELQFYGEGSLYFLDGTYLYTLNPDTMEVSNVSITDNHPKFPCSSFLIVNDVLYYTDVKTTAFVSYITLDGTQAETLDTVPGKPTIAFWNNELYYTYAGRFLYKIDPYTIDPKTNEHPKDMVAYFSDDVVSMQIQDNVFVCTTLGGDFYAYNLSELASTENAENVTPLAHYQGSYSSLALLGNYVYAVKSASICQYDLNRSEFTDFEICNASDSVHRLRSGADVLLFDDRLYIADNGNSRISVYDTQTQTFDAPIPLDFSPNYLAGDENTLLAADGSQAILYDITAESYGKTVTVFNGFKGTLVGAVNVYGKYYFATDSNHYYVATETITETDGNTERVWSLTESQKSSTRYAKLLASDSYGYLYVANGSGVYRFTEESFLEPAIEGEALPVTLPANTKKILVDYNGGVYALANGKLQKATEDVPYALNEPLVYSESATVESFAFGIEDNVTYVLYKENYLAETGLLDLPTVKTIPVNGVDQDIFSSDSADVEIVRLRENAMLIDFDLSTLAGAELFPYLHYSRNKTPLTALKIGETADGKHTVVAFYDSGSQAYRACLALNGDCLALTEEEQKAHYQTYAQPQTMYVSNDVPVYKFPHLSDLPTVTTLTRNTKITVLGEINGLQYPYYHIEYVDGDNVTHTGYLPKDYAIGFDPAPSAPTTDVYGNTTSDKDRIQRLVFLLLGGAAILILTDALIFHIMKKKKDD